MSWLLSPSSATKMMAKLIRKACTTPSTLPSRQVHPERPGSVGPRDRHAFVGPGVGRAQLGDPIEDDVDDDACFEAGQAGTRAHVGPTAEREVAAQLRSVE